MITYNGMDLFSSGPSAIDPGPNETRDAAASAPGAVGATVVTQGLLPRKLVQRGTLVADDAEALQALIDSIQQQLGTATATLIDQHGKAWSDCLMRQLEYDLFSRIGPRISTNYEITYLQTHP